MEKLAQLPVVFLGIFSKPNEVFQLTRADPGVGFPLLFAATMGLLSGIVAAFVGGDNGVNATVGGGILGGICGGLIFGVVGAVILGAVVHGLSRLLGGTSEFYNSIQAVSFAMATLPVANLLGRWPILAAMPMIYGLVVMVLGVAEVHDLSIGRSVASVLAALLLVIGTPIGLVFALASQVSSNNREQFEAQFDQFDRKVKEEKARREAEAARAPVAAVPPTVAPAPVEPPTPAPTPVAVMSLAVSLSSEPPGAEVFQMPENKRLGITPMIFKTQMGEPAVPLRFAYPGMPDETRDVSGDLQSVVTVRFEKKK